MKTLHAPAPAPRWPTLAALVAAVLGVHMALLLGPMPWASATAALAPAAHASGAPAPAGRSASVSATHPATDVPLARVSTVRWIVPMAVAEPTIARTAPAPRAAPPVRSPATPEAQARVAPSPVMAVRDEAPAEHATEPSATLGPSTTPPGDELLAAAAVDTPSPAATPTQGTALPPAQPPASARLDYAVSGRIKGLAYNAEGKLDWTVADGRYSARMEMRMLLLGSRVQTSTGRVGAAGLMPERFSDKSRSEKAAHFEVAQNRIRFSNNAPEAVLLPGAQDRLSLFLQLASLLQARPQAYASGQIIDMQVAGTGDADIWRFKVGEETTLSLPAGQVRVRHLVRQPRKEFDSTVEMWLAPELQHLPVRLRVTQPNGDVADQQLSRMP